jgi:hypothetical protein
VYNQIETASDEQRERMLAALNEELEGYEARVKANKDSGNKAEVEKYTDRANSVRASIKLWEAGTKSKAKGKSTAKEPAKEPASDEPDESWSRAKLDAAAADAGVAEPEKLANKADVVAAIAEAKKSA